MQGGEAGNTRIRRHIFLRHGSQWHPMHCSLYRSLDRMMQIISFDFTECMQSLVLGLGFRRLTLLLQTIMLPNCWFLGAAKLPGTGVQVLIWALVIQFQYCT